MQHLFRRFAILIGRDRNRQFPVDHKSALQNDAKAFQNWLSSPVAPDARIVGLCIMRRWVKAVACVQTYDRMNAFLKSEQTVPLPRNQLDRAINRAGKAERFETFRCLNNFAVRSVEEKLWSAYTGKLRAMRHAADVPPEKRALAGCFILLHKFVPRVKIAVRIDP